MTKNHLKRLNVPNTWDVLKRTNVFITRPNPGGHSIDMAIPLIVVLRDMLKITNTLNETISLLRNTEVQINNNKIKDPKQQIGMMDILSFKETGKHYRLILNAKGKLTPVEIKEAESKVLPLRIVGKTKIKGNKMQLNLFGGNNLIVDKDQYKVGDTVIVDPTSNKITGHYGYDKGMMALLTGGNHIGSVGTIEDIKGKNIIYKNKSGDVFETLKKYAYIVGDKKEAITL